MYFVLLKQRPLGAGIESYTVEISAAYQTHSLTTDTVPPYADRVFSDVLLQVTDYLIQWTCNTTVQYQAQAKQLTTLTQGK